MFQRCLSDEEMVPRLANNLYMKWWRGDEEESGVYLCFGQGGILRMYIDVRSGQSVISMYLCERMHLVIYTLESCLHLFAHEMTFYLPLADLAEAYLFNIY